MSLNTNTIGKLQRIANRCREAKGWKPGTLFARAEQENIGNLYIYALIGASWFDDGVTADSVRQALASLKGIKTLNIFINSEGGDVFEAKAIYAQLKRFSAEGVEIICHIDGIAASAATFVAMAGDKIITAPEATWMVHEAWTFAGGNASDLRDTADLLDMMNEDIASIYSKRTGRSMEEMRAVMAKETWMNAQEALAGKFTDEVASYNEPEDAKAAAAKSTLKIAAVTESTSQRLAAMTSDLLVFRAKRAGELIANNPKISDRASAVQQRAKPASR